jgi:DNA polymerase III epsilon subunit-like protein
VTGPVCFVDTETTGLDPDRHEIWEVGLILPDGAEHRWFLPVDLGRADARALAIGRFHDRYPKPSYGPRPHIVDGVTDLDDFAYEFAELTRGRHLVGAVVSFDAERLSKLLRANGACPEWHYHLIDVEALAVGYLAGTRGTTDDDTSVENLVTPPWKSDQLTEALGIHVPEAEKHTALGDARWAKAIYEAVMGR